MDTNCWMQTIKERSESDLVRRLLTDLPSELIHISDFSVHSIGVLMLRYRIIDRYESFLSGTLIRGQVGTVSVPNDKLSLVADACIAHRLDFDDAYQYVAAELHGLKLVSLDSDFDRTPNGRLTPAAALERFREEQNQRQQES